MPVSKAQRWMGRKWPIILERAAEYARLLPPEGVSRMRFIADVLFDVDPRVGPDAVELLGRRKVIWLSTYRGEVTVYGSKPEVRPERTLAGKKPIDALFADLGPLLVDAAQFAKCQKPFGWSPEVEEGAQAAIGRIVAVCQRHALKGVPLADMRACMWSVLSPGLMHSISRYEPRLQKQSETEAFPVERPRPKRLPRGSSPKQKAMALIERAGTAGITKTDVLKGIQPRMSANDLGDVIGELENEGAIVWAEMRKDAASRKGDRLFSAAVGLPVVRPDGTMRRRIEGEYYG